MNPDPKLIRKWIFLPIETPLLIFWRKGMMRHIVHTIIEVRCRLPRIFGKIKATKGETLSFTAFLLHCLGKAVDENKIMHAYRSGRHQLVLFNDVDAETIIEREVEGRKLPISHIIRSINKKSVKELHDESDDKYRN